MQSYLLPYHVTSRGGKQGGKIVLMCRKNIRGYKADGKKLEKPIVWNSAGQWVISGGKKQSTEKNEEAAMREFFEETGIDFRPNTKLEEYGLQSQITTKLFSLNSSSPLFSVTYIPFKHWEYLALDISKNISAGNVTDDELYEVQWTTPNGVLEKMLGKPQISSTVWMKSQMDEVGAKLGQTQAEKLLKEQMSKPWDWFEIAIKNLP